MPGSPLSSTTWPRPSFTRSQRCSSNPISSSRPTSGVKPAVTATSKRLRAPLSTRTWYTSSGVEIPLRVWAPRSRHAKYPWTSRCVAALMTTVSGSAIPCTRAAMLGVSPKANCSRLPPPPISPTTTRPV